MLPPPRSAEEIERQLKRLGCPAAVVEKHVAALRQARITEDIITVINGYKRR